MQREIKFRAWDSRNRVMGKGVSVLDDAFDDMVTHFQDAQYVCMQFTGLHDKNGKEIYEGDVLVVFDEAVEPVTDEGQGPIEPCNHLVPVEMRNGVWGFEIPNSDDGETGWYGLHYWNEDISSDGYEIIGNIWENGDLLLK